MKSRILILMAGVVFSVALSGCFIPPLSYQTAKTLDMGEAEITPFVHGSTLDSDNFFGGGCLMTQGLTDKLDWSMGAGFEVIDDVVALACGLRLRGELLEDKLTLTNTLAANSGGLLTIFPEIIYSSPLKREDRIITLGLGYQFQDDGLGLSALGITSKIGFQFNPKLRAETGVILMDQDEIMISFGLAIPMIFNYENRYNSIFNKLEKRRSN